MTRETLHRLVKIGFGEYICNTTSASPADVTLGKNCLKLPGPEFFIHFQIFSAQCLQKLNVSFGDTRDEWGHQTFIPLNVEDLYKEGPNLNLVRQSDFYPFEQVKSLKIIKNDKYSLKLQILRYRDTIVVQTMQSAFTKSHPSRCRCSNIFCIISRS